MAEEKNEKSIVVTPGKDFQASVILLKQEDGSYLVNVILKTSIGPTHVGIVPTDEDLKLGQAEFHAAMFEKAVTQWKVS